MMSFFFYFKISPYLRKLTIFYDSSKTIYTSLGLQKVMTVQTIPPKGNSITIFSYLLAKALVQHMKAVTNACFFINILSANGIYLGAVNNILPKKSSSILKHFFPFNIFLSFPFYVLNCGCFVLLTLVNGILFEILKVTI